MSSSLGGFAFVLHGHLPWVLHHGRWPHGEDWLFEAASETWLPLLDVAARAEREGLSLGWSLELSPILLEQLAHPRFQERFPRWLEERIARAERDAREFAARGEAELVGLAAQHARRFQALIQQFDAIDRSIPAAVAALGARVERMTSNATHGYHPLILHDACARAQIRAGIATSERHFGHRVDGAWLPECAYRPPGWWVPAVIHGDLRWRRGVAGLFGDAGVRWFVVDHHLVARSEPVASWAGDRLEPAVGVPVGHGSPLEPVRVAEEGALTPIAVVARNPRISEQVWSGKVGYPGEPAYREFHKIHGMRGLRYWRVTSAEADLADKAVYDHEAARSAARRHAAHFVGLVRAELQAWRAQTGRPGFVCAAFDAELFGHWWHEGPEFLLEVARAFAAAGDVEVAPVGEWLAAHPPTRAVALPEGTWGAGGDHRVWLNDPLRFYWEAAYRAEDRFLDLWHRAPWRTDAELARWLRAAARELLLLQASDWPFVITTKGAIDYGMRRILDHFGAFDDLANGVEDLLADERPDPVLVQSLARAELRDDPFPDLRLEWWS